MKKYNVYTGAKEHVPIFTVVNIAVLSGYALLTIALFKPEWVAEILRLITKLG